MKMKISVKIFSVLLIAFVLILGISMKVNLDAQYRAYDELIRSNFTPTGLFDDIYNDLGIKIGQPQNKSIDDLKKQINSKEFEKKMKDNVGDWSMLFFIETQDSSLNANNHIIKEFYPYNYKDNYIQLAEEKEAYSLEKIPFEKRQSLLKYYKNKKFLGSGSIEYVIENNDIVYLNWNEDCYGKKREDFQLGTLSSMAVNGQRLMGGFYDLKPFIVKDKTINKLIQDMWLDNDSVGGYGSYTEVKDNISYHIYTASLTENPKHNLHIVKIAANNTYDYAWNVYLQNNIWLYVVAFVLVVLVSFVFSFVLSRKIKRLENATLKIANQNFDEEIDVKSHDEIGSLAKSIDMMRMQLKETISKLEQEIEKVKELENLRKDFVNQFTHEMKTPLGIINGYSELIEEADDEEDIKKYLEIINRETKRINQLVQSMLSLSRLESGKVELKKIDIDLEELVTEIIDEYEVLLMKKNIKVEVKNVSSMVYADEKMMNTVLHNFISNAIKHTYENGCIVITLDNGCYVYNEGKQIENNRLSHIWHTFVTNDQEGSGLGLAICRSIFELHCFAYGVKNIDNGVEFHFSGYRS